MNDTKLSYICINPGHEPGAASNDTPWNDLHGCRKCRYCICPWMDGSRTTQEQLSRSKYLPSMVAQHPHPTTTEGGSAGFASFHGCNLLGQCRSNCRGAKNLPCGWWSLPTVPDSHPLQLTRQQFMSPSCWKTMRNTLNLVPFHAITVIARIPFNEDDFHGMAYPLCSYNMW